MSITTSSTRRAATVGGLYVVGRCRAIRLRSRIAWWHGRRGRSREAHRRRTPRVDRSRHQEPPRASSTCKGGYLADLARAGQYRPGYRPLHARWKSMGDMRWASRDSAAPIGRSIPVNNDPQWPSKARACRQALEIDKHLSAAHVCLGMVSNGSGQHADARAAYEKAIESDELSDEGLLGLAFAEEHLRLQRGRTDASAGGGPQAALLGHSLVAREFLSRAGPLQGGRRAAHGKPSS